MMKFLTQVNLEATEISFTLLEAGISKMKVLAVSMFGEGPLLASLMVAVVRKLLEVSCKGLSPVHGGCVASIASQRHISRHHHSGCWDVNI